MAGIYLHIPFCQRRCIYCDFYSTTQEEKRERYVHALCRELEMRRTYLDGEAVETVYFGGGTPSRLQADDWERLFDCLERLYGLSACKEITLEANPDDLDEAYVQMLRRFPFNRLSIGIQTFHDPTLQLLQRRHTARQAKEAVERCKRSGFRRLSIDLIYGLPGEDEQQWADDLRQALELEVEHISAYHLTYEEGTRLWQLRRERKVSEAAEEQSLAFFSRLIDTLTEAGYEHYEISNFCLPGCCALHNSGYWTGRSYLGCGPSAHSYNGTSRQWNVASLDDYLAHIEKGELLYEKEELDLPTRYNDRILTSIRTAWGLSLPQLRAEFGEAFYRHCLRCARQYVERGLLEIKKDTLRLTRQGIFVSDSIMSDLFYIDD